MNEQLAIKRSMQLQNLFGNAGSGKDLLNQEPKVYRAVSTRFSLFCSLSCMPARLASSAAVSGPPEIIFTRLSSRLRDECRSTGSSSIVVLATFSYGVEVLASSAWPVQLTPRTVGTWTHHYSHSYIVAFRTLETPTPTSIRVPPCCDVPKPTVRLSSRNPFSTFAFM